MPRFIRSLIPFALVVSIVGIPAPAVGQAAPTITLDATQRWIDYGRTTQLFGEITPEAGDQEINIIDHRARVLATTTTKDDGSFRVTFRPRSNVTVRAEWAGTLSNDVTLKVRPRIRVELGTVRLFDKSGVWGRVEPGDVRKQVTIELRRGGKVEATKRVEPRKGGWFRTKFLIRKPGAYTAAASYRGPDYLSASDKSSQRATPLPSLSSGSNSMYVKLLEKRLRQLHYRLPSANYAYDRRTADAIIAFNKVNGRARVSYVTDSTWRALASPLIPKPKFSWPRYHIEVDQTKQVLYRVLNNKVITIMHVSTGAGSATRDGTFDFDSKLAGYSSKRLYHPSFFDGARAIHGWPEVPTYNASHGCVRVPMWTAVWIFERVEIGDLIRIYH